jgi:hypothetical protein
MVESVSPIENNEVESKSPDVQFMVGNEEEIETNCQEDENSNEKFLHNETDGDIESDINQCVSEMSELKVDLWTPKNYQEEYDCEKLTKLLVSQLSPSDKLQNILGNRNFYNA